MHFPISSLFLLVAWSYYPSQFIFGFNSLLVFAFKITRLISLITRAGTFPQPFLHFSCLHHIIYTGTSDWMEILKVKPRFYFEKEEKVNGREEWWRDSCCGHLLNSQITTRERETSTQRPVHYPRHLLPSSLHCVTSLREKNHHQYTWIGCKNLVSFPTRDGMSVRIEKASGTFSNRTNPCRREDVVTHLEGLRLMKQGFKGNEKRGQLNRPVRLDGHSVNVHAIMHACHVVSALQMLEIN